MATPSSDKPPTTTPSPGVANFKSVQHRKFLCVEYPGYINNVDNMVSTLGGIDKLSDTYFKNKCRLQMTYRPEDLNAHKVCADLTPSTGILMKVRRRKKKKPGTTTTTKSTTTTTTASIATTKDEVEYEYQQEIIGFVRNQYKFQSLMDYQYLTPKPMWDFFNNIHGSELGRMDMPLYCAPPSFGRIDTCGGYNYRPDPVSTKRLELARKGINEAFEHNPQESTATGRKRRQTESMAALFLNEEIPQEPSANSVTIIKNLIKGPDTETIETVRKLFEERPIWSKLALSCHLSNINLDRLKKVIQYFSYYWLSGPWRTMWCRFGYDPRKDPTAKIYQMIDFRVRDSKESKVNYAELVPKRSYKNYVPRNLQSRNVVSTSVLAASEEPSVRESDDAEPYVFRPDKMLPCRNMMYQLCDLHDDKVQAIIHENDGKEGECNEKEGWFPIGTMNRVRVQLGKAVVAYFEKEKKKKQGVTDEEAVMEVVEAITDVPICEVVEEEEEEEEEVEEVEAQGFCLVDSLVDNQAYDSDGPSFSYMQLLQGDVDAFDLNEYSDYG